MSTTRPIILLDGVTEDTVGDWKANSSGLYIVVCEGDFGGGTVTLQTTHDVDAGDPQDVYDGNGILYEIDSSSDYASRIILTDPLSIRATLAGATDPNLTVKLA